MNALFCIKHYNLPAIHRPRLSASFSRAKCQLVPTQISNDITLSPTRRKNALEHDRRQRPPANAVLFYVDHSPILQQSYEQ